MNIYYTLQMEKWFRFDKCKMKLLDALMLLDNIVDESDSDVMSFRPLQVISSFLSHSVNTAVHTITMHLLNLELNSCRH